MRSASNSSSGCKNTDFFVFCLSVEGRDKGSSIVGIAPHMRFCLKNSTSSGLGAIYKTQVCFITLFFLFLFILKTIDKNPWEKYPQEANKYWSHPYRN